MNKKVILEVLRDMEQFVTDHKLHDIYKDALRTKCRRVYPTVPFKLIEKVMKKLPYSVQGDEWAFLTELIDDWIGSLEEGSSAYFNVVTICTVHSYIRLENITQVSSTTLKIKAHDSAIRDWMWLLAAIQNDCGTEDGDLFDGAMTYIPDRAGYFDTEGPIEFSFDRGVKVKRFMNGSISISGLTAVEMNRFINAFRLIEQVGTSIRNYK